MRPIQVIGRVFERNTPPARGMAIESPNAQMEMQLRIMCKKPPLISVVMTIWIKK